jgi:hypothetical protein
MLEMDGEVYEESLLLELFLPSSPFQFMPYIHEEYRLDLPGL